jgi:hypothetical protein
VGGRIRDGHEDHLGKTLFTTRELPQGYYRFRIVKLGFQPILASGGILGEPLEFNLDREGSIPADMVRVPGGTVAIPGLDTRKTSAFLIDRKVPHRAASGNWRISEGRSSGWRMGRIE